MCEGHIVLSLVCCIADHKSLITCSDVFLLSVYMNSLSYFTWLLVEWDNDRGCFVVHSNIDRIVANFLNGLSNDLLDVGVGFCADLSENHANRIFHGSLACYLRFWIFGEASVKDRIWDIVTEFVGVSTGDTFGGEKEVTFLRGKMLFLHPELYCWLKYFYFYPISKVINQRGFTNKTISMCHGFY